MLTTGYSTVLDGACSSKHPVPSPSHSSHSHCSSTHALEYGELLRLEVTVSAQTLTAPVPPATHALGYGELLCLEVAGGAQTSGCHAGASRGRRAEVHTARRNLAHLAGHTVAHTGHAGPGAVPADGTYMSHESYMSRTWSLTHFNPEWSYPRFGQHNWPHAKFTECIKLITRITKTAPDAIPHTSAASGDT